MGTGERGRRAERLGESVRAAAERAADLVAVLTARPGPRTDATPKAPPETEPTTVEVTEVAQVLLAHGETEPLGLTRSDVVRMRKVAVSLREVFAAPTVEEVVRLLNALLARYAHPPRLTDHGGRHAWHLHVDGHDDGPWDEWLAASSSLALATVVADRQRRPGGLCASPSCGKPFVDLGGGSPRRYCTARCATRERVAAHRARSASAGGPG